MLEITDLKTEYLVDPLGIDAAAPRFSWKLKSDRRGVRQTGFRIRAVDRGRENTVLWDCCSLEEDSEENDSNGNGNDGNGKSHERSDSQRIRYAGRPLTSRQQVSWQVEVTAVDENGAVETAISEQAGFEMGLLQKTDWVGRWLEPEDEADPEVDKPALYLRKCFFVKPGLKRARIYQTAHGLYHFWLNGMSGTEDCFKPGLTSYYHRIQYQAYDITRFLREGDNCWAVVLSDGWWRGATGGTVRNNFGYKLHFLGQIELFYEDGTTALIGSDESFRWSTGGLLASDMQMGDCYDAGKEPEGWKNSCFDDSAWKRVHLAGQGDTFDHTDARLIASASVPVREMETFPAKVFTDQNGKTVLDFGQNIAGYVRMKLRSTQPGQTIHLTHGEALKKGCFSVENINQLAYQADHFQEIFYICRGDGMEEYCPRFSVFGFRYVMLEGYEKESIQEGDFTAVAVYSAMEETGHFTCSHTLINKLVHNSLWSQKGNFLDVAVDCPTRERNAWTGDAQIYARTASLFMDTYSFYEKWLQDQTIEQYDSGKVGITFPSTSSVHNPEELARVKKSNPLAALAGPAGNGSIGEDAVGWGDSAVWIPFMVYLSFGDRRILDNQYETGRKWLEFELASARVHNPKYEGQPQYHHVGEDGTLDGEYIYDTNFQYGEWNEAIEKTPREQQEMMQMLARAGKEGKSILEILAKDGKPEVATAYMYRSAMAVSCMAQILGKVKEAAHYAAIAHRIKDVYCTYLIGDGGIIEKGHQAPYVLSLIHI